MRRKQKEIGKESMRKKGRGEERREKGIEKRRDRGCKARGRCLREGEAKEREGAGGRGRVFNQMFVILPGKLINNSSSNNTNNIMITIIIMMIIKIVITTNNNKLENISILLV
jgi:hypothetical protein